MTFLFETNYFTDYLDSHSLFGIQSFLPDLNNHKVNFSDEKKEPDITNMKPEQSVTAPL